jgi:hypothetical protein
LERPAAPKDDDLPGLRSLASFETDVYASHLKAALTRLEDSLAKTEVTHFRSPETTASRHRLTATAGLLITNCAKARPSPLQPVC